MKRYSNILLPLCALAFIGLWACKREVTGVTFLGGTAPTLTASLQDSVPLSFANQDNEAVVLSWNNPEYKFSTGISSHDVSYTIEIDSTGRNFTGLQKQTLQVSKELSYTFTQRKLNTIIYQDMGFAIGVPAQIIMRVIASIKASSGNQLEVTKLVSNAISLRVTPYTDPTLVPPDLYITGNALPSDWTNTPPANQKFTYLGAKTYEISTHDFNQQFAPGKLYKFLTNPGQWQPQYGAATDGLGTPTALSVNDGSTTDPPAIPTPSVAGHYKITVNLGNNTFVVNPD